MAITADGKIASENRVVDSFSSRRDHAHLLDLRAGSDAVMCGAGTAAAGVTLGTGGQRYQRLRSRRGMSAQLLRVVVSGGARIQPGSAVFTKSDAPLIVLVAEDAPGGRVQRLRRLGVEVRAFGTKGVDLTSALRWLRRERQVRRLVCEGGGELNDAMFRAGLVDEVHLTLCPKVFGGKRAPTLADGIGVARLAEATRLELSRARRVGDELFLVYRVVDGLLPPAQGNRYPKTSDGVGGTG